MTNKQATIRAAFLAEFMDFINERQDMTIGEIVYSFSRDPFGKISALLEKTDEQMLQNIEKAKKNETDG
jgi:hypothetical protein